MDGKSHVSRSMRETYVFQNACITHVKKRTLNAWCSIYTFNVRFTYVSRTVNVRYTFCCVHQQTNPKRNVTTQKRHQKLRLHNDCGPTKDGQFG